MAEDEDVKAVGEIIHARGSGRAATEQVALAEQGTAVTAVSQRTSERGTIASVMERDLVMMNAAPCGLRSADGAH